MPWSRALVYGLHVLYIYLGAYGMGYNFGINVPLVLSYTFVSLHTFDYTGVLP